VSFLIRVFKSILNLQSKTLILNFTVYYSGFVIVVARNGESSGCRWIKEKEITTKVNCVKLPRAEGSWHFAGLSCGTK
jgi:hypothetical protein